MTRVRTGVETRAEEEGEGRGEAKNAKRQRQRERERLIRRGGRGWVIASRRTEWSLGLNEV